MWVPRLPLMSEVGTPLVETPSSHAITPQLTKLNAVWLRFLVVEHDVYASVKNQMAFNAISLVL